MKFKKIELIGFKSFEEKTVFLIEDGLTGIVGPNGCGKSNIVESIKWCMGETSAISMRGSGMEDVIFSGTANKPSKNIAEVTLTLDNKDKDGPSQFKELDLINIKRRIVKDKGSKYYINDKEVRARDAQTFFADISTGAHSPSIISQGRIGALVTAKPTDRRIILEEAAGIAGIHARRHESELRLNSAENNLKRADELRRQQEKQLENLKKQAEEASRYKNVSDEIKKIEANIYLLKLEQIVKEIKLCEKNMNETDDEVSGHKIEINHKNNLLESENKKIQPLRDKNLEILSKLQRINLDMENLNDQENRNKEEKNKLISLKKVVETDLEREKEKIIDCVNNEKRLLSEKNNLIDTEKSYYEMEVQSNKDLDKSKNELNEQQANLEKISKNLVTKDSNKKLVSFFVSVNEKLDSCKKDISEKNYEIVSEKLEAIVSQINAKIASIEKDANEVSGDQITKITNELKNAQEKYANVLSKNQTIKTEVIKRQSRIKNIEDELKNWINLKISSEKMLSEFNRRLVNAEKELDQISKKPEKIAINKGQLMQATKSTEEDRDILDKDLKLAEKEYEAINEDLKKIQEKMIVSRENRAKYNATLEGLVNRKKDLINRIQDHLGVDESGLQKIASLENESESTSIIALEKNLEDKKKIRASLGSVNLRADVETEQFKQTIKKMEEDREDLVSAIVKLRASINELNQKGRERLLEAFDIVNRKFNEVYTKLFSGGNAKLELVDSDDPLEAGLEMLVSPPGKRLQSITLLSGGEQALTALSLIFAVFLSNPSPICILDEVDAPLDDANVTRFCSLLNELTKITQTKFIIITHHALTMSKMNRLYGITMAEKGISQLVAVDLERAEELVA